MQKHILLLALCFCSFNLFAQVAVIVHPSNANAIDAKQIANIYLIKKSTFADGSKAIPVRLGGSNAATEVFNSKAVGRSATQLQAHWSKLMFTGKGQMPKELSEADLLKQVASNPAMIGYIDNSKVDGTVKVVATF